MLPRQINHNLSESLQTFPITALLGPRQVGKTTLAKHLVQQCAKPVIYLDLELTSDLNKLQSPELYLRSQTDSLIVIDEIQRMPQLFPLLRALVDQDRRPGRFMLLGSASPDIIRHASESLAGRVMYHELTPFCSSETGADSIDRLWLRGGYPDSFLAGWCRG